MKAGDKIKCVGPIEGTDGITIGKIYEVDRMDYANDPHIINDKGNCASYMAHRFRVVDGSDIHNQVDRAISLIGKTVQYDDNVFVVTNWGIGNKNNEFPQVTDYLQDGVCVYVESDGDIAALCNVTEVNNTIKLTDDYNATIDGKVVQVGCQSIPIEKVQEILDLYNTLNK